ncbi:MAG: double-cubane-cluster-containing anaerobic reductase [Candidatus Thiodiazotropha sp.]
MKACDPRELPYAQSRQAGESQTMLDRIKDGFSDNPKGMEYFYELFKRVYCRGEALQHSGPLVGTTCVQVPEELIYALGATPVRLCNGSYHYDNRGADFMPAKSCSLVKATLGMLNDHPSQVPRMGSLELVVNPTTCDQKTKAGSMIRDMGYPVYDMELPRAKDSDNARLYWRESVQNLTQELTQALGRKLSRGELKRAMSRTARARHAFRELHRIRRQTPVSILGKDVFLVTNAYFFDDLDRWCDAVELLNEELQERLDSGFKAAQAKAPRILFTGSPPIFPNLKLPLLIEESGAVVVADESCSANRMLYDLTAVDEWRLYDMVDAIADRYLKPCTCPIFNHNEDRRRRLLELAESYAVDGVVYQSFAGCQVYEMEQRSIAEAMSSRGLPMLYVETDYSPDDMGQLSTRIEAFVEAIKGRKRRAR